MDVVRALSEEIGPRPACSREEARAAGWCSARLGEMGYEVTVESFASRADCKPWHAVFFSIALAGAVLVVVLPLAAVVLGCAAAVLYARDADGRPLIKPRAGESRNVVARSPGSAEPDVVVVAHVDSARSSLLFHPRFVPGIRIAAVILHGALFLVPLLGAAAWIAEAEGGPPRYFGLASGAVAAVLAFATALHVHAYLRMPAVPGANDNASGVEVLMRLASERPEGVWFVVTGSEDAGMIGIQAFLDTHAHEVGGARFVNLDSVGAGRLIAAEEEGMVSARRADPVMLRAAEDAGAEAVDFRALPTDATVLLARKYKALSLLAVDDRGVPPNWHRPGDVAENVDPGAVDRAAEVARSVVAAARKVATG